jgi:hypothetical protein
MFNRICLCRRVIDPTFLFPPDFFLYVNLVAKGGKITPNHRLNLELDLQSLFGLLCTAVLIGSDPAPPPPPHFGSYMKALLVSQDRRHLFVTPPAPNLFLSAGHGCFYIVLCPEELFLIDLQYKVKEYIQHRTSVQSSCCKAF